MEAAHAVPVLVVETSDQEATAAWGSIMILVKDPEDQAALAEKEARERVSGVEA
jgi:hypothetical protein